MIAFRMLLATLFGIVFAYTAVVSVRHGLMFLPIFLGDIAKLEWPGQFNVDFACFLILSGTWVAWRHRFTAAGLGLALLAVSGGSLFLSAYLLVQSLRTRGDMATLMLGPSRTGR